ncbi:hypothetical protein GCM10028816_20720 [Spirosoma lituiforme]
MGQNKRSDIRFPLSDMLGGEKNLPLQIAFLYYIAINYAHRTHTRSRQVLPHRTAESTGSNDRYAGLFQLLLTGQTHFGQPDVPVVPVPFSLRHIPISV